MGIRASKRSFFCNLMSLQNVLLRIWMRFKHQVEWKIRLLKTQFWSIIHGFFISLLLSDFLALGLLSYNWFRNVIRGRDNSSDHRFGWSGLHKHVKNMTTQATTAVFHFICCLNRLISVTSLDRRNSHIPNCYSTGQQAALKISIFSLACALNGYLNRK